MVGSEELMCALITYGRRSLQGIVARSGDVSDATTYLLVELNLEIARVMSFKTMDLVTFEMLKRSSEYFKKAVYSTPLFKK